MSTLSSLSRTLRYLRGIACFPQQRRLGFLEMGLGIESRHEKFGRYWQSHIEACRSQQQLWLASQTKPSREASLAILGAGRLLDVAFKDLEKHFAQIALIDGDPLSKKYWKIKSSASLSKQIIEVSGVIASWAKTLSTNSSPSWEAALSELQSIAENKSPQLPRGPLFQTTQYDAVLSLNILSQIPIVWQNVVEDHLKKRFGLSAITAKESEWIQAFVPSAKMLVEQHLADLNHSGAANILLICDIEYARYQSERDYTRSLGLQAPIGWNPEDKRWAPSSTSATPEEIHCELQNALYGIELNDPAVRARYLDKYTLTSSTEWTWHIQPQGFERRSSGMIHRVGAFHLELR